MQTEIDVKTILNGTPTYMIGQDINQYANIIVGEIEIENTIYTVNAVFDIDTDVKTLVITDTNDTILGEIKNARH